MEETDCFDNLLQNTILSLEMGPENFFLVLCGLLDMSFYISFLPDVRENSCKVYYQRCFSVKIPGKTFGVGW